MRARSSAAEMPSDSKAVVCLISCHGCLLMPYVLSVMAKQASRQSRSDC